MLSIADAASKLNLSTQQVRNLCRDGKVHAEKVGRSWVIDEMTLTLYKSSVEESYKVAEDHPRYVTSINSKPKVLSFFSGAMGMDIGLERAGLEVILACEFDKACRETIVKNKPDIALLGDITEYSPEEVMESAGLKLGDEVDLIVGGPPCQAFSTAGKRRGFSDERGNAFLAYVDLALKIKPKYIVIENVRGLLSCPLEHRPHNLRGKDFPNLSEDELKGGALHFVIQRLKNVGFSVSFNLYNSANFGTPQIRERVIMICSRDGKTIPYLQPTHSESGQFGLPKWNTFKDAVKGLRKKDHQHLSFPEKRLKYYRLLKSGQNWRNLPDNLQREAMGKSYFAGGGKTGFYRRIAWDKPSPTVVTHPAMPATDLGHPKEDRPLSVQEYKRIQEFPDDWILAGGMIAQYKQIGNAVPISLGEAVGNAILSHMNGESTATYDGFKYSRYKCTDHISWIENFENQAKQLSNASAQTELAF